MKCPKCIGNIDRITCTEPFNLQISLDDKGDVNKFDWDEDLAELDYPSILNNILNSEYILSCSKCGYHAVNVNFNNLSTNVQTYLKRWSCRITRIVIEDECEGCEDRFGCWTEDPNKVSPEILG